ncbi:MAG: hypothetical protein ACP5JU_02995, partial [Minisyncoccia bacterium]
QDALSDFFKQCENMTRKNYKIDVIVGKVVRVKYLKDKNNNVSIVKRENFMDITKEFDECIKNNYKYWW